MTGLPPDVEIDEINDYFKRFGLIQESIEDNEKRIKMYYDDEGNFKGEALISTCAQSMVRQPTDTVASLPSPTVRYQRAYL